MGKATNTVKRGAFASHAVGRRQGWKPLFPTERRERSTGGADLGPMLAHLDPMLVPKNTKRKNYGKKQWKTMVLANHLGATLCHLGATLAPSWGYVGPSSWVYVDPFFWRLCWPMSGLCWPILGLCWPDLAATHPAFYRVFCFRGCGHWGDVQGGAFDEIETEGLVGSRRYWPKIAVMCKTRTQGPAEGVTRASRPQTALSNVTF